MKFEWQDIGHHVEKIQTWNPAKNTSAEKFAYIDLSSVDKDKKQIDSNQVQVVTCQDAPSRARQLVKSSDILVSTVRPNLNGVALVPLTLVGATASTGYCVLRANSQTLISEYLFYWVQTKSFIGDMMSKATGANYPAVSDKVIKQSKIPLPPLAEQQKIVAILDAADQLRQKDQQLVEHYTTLAQSLYLEMFGSNNPKSQQWPIVEMKELAAKHKGSMRTGPFGSNLLHSEFNSSGGVAVLGIDNAVKNKFMWPEKPRFITQEKYCELSKYQIFPNDVIVTIMGTVGRSAVVPDDIPLAINTKHLAAITLDKKLANPLFLSFSIYSNPYIISQFEAKNRGAIMSGLNLTIIKETKLALPPVALQNQFAQHIQLIEQQKQQAQIALEKSEALFNSLIQRAFKGELTQSTVT